MANGSWVDDPRRVKEEIYTFFENRFVEPKQHRPILDGTRFFGIDQQQNDMLVASFTEEEIRAAVWNCGSEKKPETGWSKFQIY